MLLIMMSFMGFVGSVIAMYIDAINKAGPNYHIIAMALFFIVLFLLLIKPEKQRTQEQIKAGWKYKDYQAVYDYLDTNKPHLSYAQDDRESLAILLFFDWIIVDDSNPDELVLTRVTTTSNDTQIFRPKNKKEPIKALFYDIHKT